MSDRNDFGLPEMHDPPPNPYEAGNGYGLPYKEHKKPDGATTAAVFVAIIFFVVIIMLVIKLGLVLFT